MPQPQYNPLIQHSEGYNTDHRTGLAASTTDLGGGNTAGGKVALDVNIASSGGVTGPIQANINQNNSPVGPANALYIQGSVSASGATLNIVSGMSANNYDLSIAAYNNTSAISGPYKLNCIKFHFSTSASRQITVTDATTGAIIAAPSSQTATDFLVPVGGIGFPSGHQFTVSVTQTSGACLMTFEAEIENGQLPMGGNPIIGGFDPSLRHSILNSKMNSAGDVMTNQRVPQVQAQWDKPLNNNAVTPSNSGGGNAPTQGNGLLTLSCGSAVTGQSDAVTNTNIIYSATAPMWVEMTAAVSAVPTNANTSVWFIYHGDDTNYIRFGLVGSNLVIQAGRGGSQYINQTITSVNVSTGQTALIPADFLRSGTAEAINVLDLNIYGLEWRYLGIGPIFITVTPPDGGAPTILYIQQRPNTEALPTTFSASLPIRQRITKASSDAQVISLVAGSWAGGTMEPAVFFEPHEIKSRKQIQMAYAAQSASLSPAYTVSPGRVLYIKSLNISLLNTNTGANGRLDILDNGTLLHTVEISAATNQGNAFLVSNAAFQVPLIFSTNVQATITGGTITYGLSFVGYERSA